MNDSPAAPSLAPSGVPSSPGQLPLRPEILVITESFDPHVDYVARRFEERGVPWLRLNLSDFPLNAAVRLDVAGGEARASLALRGREIELSSLRSVWYRRSEAFVLPPDLPREQKDLARSECQRLTSGLWNVLRDRFWVSFPARIREADHKAEQLLRAARHGFKVPPTLFTNDPDAVRAFYRQHGGAGRVVYKPHDTIMIPKEHRPEVGVVYTALLRDEHLDRIQEIAVAPGIFQPYVAKDHEVRVTVIGSRVFACRIRSQESGSTRVDWRSWDWMGGIEALPPHEPCTLPPEVEARCLALVESYGLRFAAIDFIVTPGGEWVFLESNPNGQWVWIEELTGMPMSAGLVDLLVDREKAGASASGHEGRNG